MRPLIPIRDFEVFADGLDHPEGLAFDRDGTLWAGGELGQIYRIDSKRRAREVCTLGGFNLGLTFSTKQDLFVCNLKKSALIQVDRKGRVLKSWTRGGGRPLRTPNFSVFDSEGNLYFSDSGEWQQNDGYVYILRPNGRVEEFAGPLAFPNGMSISADERTLFVVQTTADNVLAFPIRENGIAGRARVYARNLARIPDGCALDADGNLYVTCYASDNVYKVSPAGKISLLAYDPHGTMLARPTNAVFDDSGYVYFANLGRWHICRARIGAKGQLLANQR
jgi:gluconolactonase